MRLWTIFRLDPRCTIIVLGQWLFDWLWAFILPTISLKVSRIQVTPDISSTPKPVLCVWVERNRTSSREHWRKTHKGNTVEVPLQQARWYSPRKGNLKLWQIQQLADILSKISEVCDLFAHVGDSSAMTISTSWATFKKTNEFAFAAQYTCVLQRETSHFAPFVLREEWHWFVYIGAMFGIMWAEASREMTGLITWPRNK